MGAWMSNYAEEDDDESYTHPQCFFDEPLTLADIMHERVQEMQFLIRDRETDIAIIRRHIKRKEQSIQDDVRAHNRTHLKEKAAQLDSLQQTLSAHEVAVMILLSAKTKLEQGVVQNMTAEEYNRAVRCIRSISKGLTIEDVESYKQMYNITSDEIDKKKEAFVKESGATEQRVQAIMNQQIMMASRPIEVTAQ